MSEKELIKEINKRHPVNLLTYLVDDDPDEKALVLEILHANGLENIIVFDEAEDYEREIKQNPEIMPNLCLFDYLYPSRKLTGVDLTIMTIERNPDYQIIMVSGYEDFQALNEFHLAGGRQWVNKNRPNFQPLFVKVLQSAVEFLKSDLRSRHYIEKVEVPTLRTDRKPLRISDENNQSNMG